MGWRAIHDDVPQSDSLNNVGDFAERLYFRMVAVADNCGRGPGSVTKIASLCIPRLAKSSDEVLSALEDLVKVGRVLLYCEKGVWAYQIVGFDERQPVAHFKGSRMSRFPAPPDAVRGDAESAGAVPPADAVPLFDPDAVPELADPVPQQTSAGSEHTEQRRAEEKRKNPQTRREARPPERARDDVVAALVDQSLSTTSGESTPLLRLLAALPDRDEGSVVVLRRYLDELPAHAADFVREEVEAAGPRRPTAYAVGILKRWDSRKGGRGSSAAQAERAAEVRGSRDAA